MNNIANKLQFLKDISPHGGAVDLNHAILMLGALMSSKPKNILEIGIGTGFCSELLLQGIEYNQFGRLTCVDNLYDLGGNLPVSILDSLINRGVSVIEKNEKDFVSSCRENEYDFLVSDGDHNNAHEWCEQIFKIIKPNSIMFFHDISNPSYSLMKYKEEADALNKPNILFNVSSRKDENCERGWLMVINKK
jgi:predicted O-methyltransferase YrrM